ncbi:MAG: hypothetical protein DLM54_08815 [Acidimicrobiales bacterium]|nr:MAG: hypothetical protein DLM54_08815 [Acidimicrobiales bacterium]
MKEVLARFLTPEWFEELNRAAARPICAAEGSITIQQVVTGAPEGEVAYVVSVAGGRLRATLGRTADADVTITADYGTALALSRGEMSARAALLAGQIHIGGNTHALLAGMAAMQATQAGCAQTLARTSY